MAGILFVVIVVIGIAVRKVFTEYREWQSAETEKQRKWQEEQFQKRENENEKQRTWYSAMEGKREDSLSERDKQWTQMVREIQALVDKRDRESTQALVELTNQIRLLTEGFASHDAKVENGLKQFEAFIKASSQPGKRRPIA